MTLARRFLVARQTLLEPLEPRRLLAAMPSGFAELAFAPGGIAADTARNRVYVGDADGHTLRVIDTDTAAQVASIPLASEPYAVALSADGTSVLVALPFANQVQAISTASLASQRVMNVGGPLIGLAGGAGGVFYGVVTDGAADDHFRFGRDGVAQFDASTGARRRSLIEPSDLSDQSFAIETDAAGRRLLATSDWYGDDVVLAAFDVGNAAAPARLPPLPTTATSVADTFFDPASGTTYVASTSLETLEVCYANGTLAHWSTGVVSDYGNTGIGGVVGLPGTAAVYATVTSDSAYGTPTIVALDTSNGAVLQTYKLPEQTMTAGGVMTPDGRLVYLAEWEESSGDRDTVWGIGILGSSTLRLPDSPVVVTGQFFNDPNRNNVRDAGEDWFDDDAAFADVVRQTVYADLNDDGVLQYGDGDETAEPYATLYDAGTYRLTLPAGTRHCVVRLDPGEHHTTYDDPIVLPVAGATRDVTIVATGDVVAGQQVADVNFGVVAGMSVGGVFFADLDADGIHDSREPAIGDVDVYLDVNHDGQHQADEPISRTDVLERDGDYDYYGEYAFDALPGAGIVRLLNPRGYTLTTPAFASVAGVAGAFYSVDFGMRPQIAMGGALYDDANANGRRDPGEPARAGARVWLDANGDARYAKGEPTCVTDANGAYSFNVKERGVYPYPVRFRDASGTLLLTTNKRTTRFTDWQQWVARDYGTYAPAVVTINAYLDKTGNHKFSRGDHALAGVIVFIDADNDGKQDRDERSALTDEFGNVVFDGLTPGTYVIRVRVDSRLRATTPSSFTYTLGQGQARSASTGMR